MSRSARITLAVVGTLITLAAAAGGSWLIAALDGPLWAIALLVAIGFGTLVGLGCGLSRSGREPSWQEREARRYGYPSDGDTCHVCTPDCDLAVDMADLAVDGHIGNPEMPLKATPERRDFFNVLDGRDQDCDRDRWSS